MRLLDGEEEPETIRYMAYSQIIESVFGKLGSRRRKRVGWCFNNMVNTLFQSGTKQTTLSNAAAPQNKLATS